MSNIPRQGAGNGPEITGKSPSDGAFPEDLLAWFDRAGRALPWRTEDADTYAIAVSEVMLQQTRVETVIPRYERFLARFPTVERLAAGSEEEVLAEWSGLGYYRRARSLRRTAMEVVARGGWPETAAGLGELPGFGAYTAAAVASIAFGERTPVLDGNVKRVFARRLALSEEPGRAEARKRILEAAADWISEDRPGDSNQALMELGATICVPRNPRCGECPLRPGCRGAESGEPERFPVSRGRKEVVRLPMVTVLVARGDRFLLFRRGEGESVLAGLWETPWVEASEGKGSLEDRLADRYGGRWSLGQNAGRVVHSVTHRRLEVEVRRGMAEWPGRSGRRTVEDGAEAAWFGREEVSDLPASSLLTKVLRLA